MLLSPIGSPSKFQASLCLPLPPLAHHADADPDVDSDDSESASDGDSVIEFELVLPVELIFYIVELASSTHRRSALALCLVASWVRAVVLPCMYNTVILHGSTPSPFDRVGAECGALGLFRRSFISEPPRMLPSPLRHIRSLWLDIPAERAPPTLDACPQLQQLALPLEAHETICRSHFWRDPMRRDVTPCRSFTVLGQSHPHRWAPLTQSKQGLAFLRGLTHLRLLNLCLSHYIPLEYTPSLTHLCLPFFDLRVAEGAAAFSGLDYILAQPHLRMVVLTLNPRYWRFDEMSLKGWAVRAMARDERLYVVAATRDDATRDWDAPRRDWEDEAHGGPSVWDKAIQVRRKFLARLSRNWDA
ncbi:hypothetical protein DFH11DRAFT_1587061 [Phellopilus nigrolimitatus]|nr:hypothetical protein DFH11DRAFT_1587061 [Phellopilus nigrolimitatus]